MNTFEPNFLATARLKKPDCHTGSTVSAHAVSLNCLNQFTASKHAQIRCKFLWRFVPTIEVWTLFNRTFQLVTLPFIHRKTLLYNI